MKWRIKFERDVEEQRSGYTEEIVVDIEVPEDFNPTGLTQVLEDEE